jgi:hypothetical protein
MRTFASPLKNKATLTKSSGEVAEWSIAAVLKTVVPRGTRGSNPCLSAINVGNQQITKQTPNFTPNNVKLGVFVLFKKTAERLCIDQ